jgi:hypothetical protein
MLGIKDEPWCEGSCPRRVPSVETERGQCRSKASRREQLELVAGLAEAYGECEDLGG